MTSHGMKVLKAMAAFDGMYDPTYLHMQTIADISGFTRAEARRIVRYLARQGYTKYSKGLWDHDDKPAGAGYCVTTAGHELIERAVRETT